jgi:F0F1-type ATP synthase assembly protein I
MAGKGPRRPSWLWRYFGKGSVLGIVLEYVAPVAGFSVVGHYFVDRNWNTGPWGMLIGAALGLVKGTYRLVQETQMGSKPPVGESPKPPAEP